MYIKHYQYYVKSLKAAILSCFVIFLVIVIYSSLDNFSIRNEAGNDSKLTKFVNNKAISSSLDIKLVNPKFFGISEDQRPYTILSREGTQINKNLIELMEVYSDIILDVNNFIALKANRGALKLDADDLELIGQVEILIDDSYIISTEQALLNLQKRSGRGNNLIKVSNASGVIIADEFEVTDNYKEVIFKGKRVKTTINSNLTR